MIKVYVSLIEKGLRTIEEVPEKYREEVEKIINKK